MTEPGRLEGVALVTGGTGGLGQAVVAELLDAGARVVTPWLVEREREGSRRLWATATACTLVEANLLEGGAEAAVAAAKEQGRARARWSTWSAASPRGTASTRPPQEQFEKMLALNLTTALNSSRAAIPELLAGGGGAIVCVGTKVAYEPFSGGGRLRDLEVGGAGPGPLPRRGVPRRRDPRQRDRPEHHRHAGQPRVDARRRPLQVGAAGRDRARDPLPLLGGLDAGDRAPRSPSTARRAEGLAAGARSAACCPTGTSCSSRSRSASRRWATGSRSPRSACTSRS